MEDRKRWNRYLLHPRNHLKPSLSVENGVGASLPLVRVGWLRTDFGRVLAGTHSVSRRSLPTLASMSRKSPVHSVYGRSFVWQEPAPRYFWAPSCLQKKRREVLHTVGKNLGPLPNERRRAPPGQDPPPNLFYT